MVRLISIEPASRITGWALYENAKLKQSDIIDFSKSKLEPESRLYYMKLRILELLEEYKPQIVVVEVSRSSNNIKVQRMLSELDGVIEGWGIKLKSDDEADAILIGLARIIEMGEFIKKEKKL